MTHHQKLDKRKSREAAIGLVVIVGLCGFLSYLIYLRLHNKHITPDQTALSGKTIYYKDSPDGLVATDVQKKSSLVQLPDLESNEIVNLGEMKRTSPERFFQLAGSSSFPRTTPTDPGTRIASVGNIPPGIQKSTLEKLNPAAANPADGVNVAEAAKSLPSTVGSPSGIATEQNALSSIPENRDSGSPNNGLPPLDVNKKDKKSQNLLDSIPGRDSEESKDFPLPPTNLKSSDEEKGQGGKQANTKGQKPEENTLFANIPKPLSNLGITPAENPTVQIDLTKQLADNSSASSSKQKQSDVKVVNHYVEAARQPNTLSSNLPLLTSLYHESWKTAKSTPNGRHYIAMSPNESLEQFSFRVTGSPGFGKAIRKLNRNRAAADGRFAAGSILQVMSADALVRKYPELCPKGRLYMSQVGDTFFSIAHQQLDQAGRFTEVMELNRHLLSIFGVKSFSGTEEIPAQTPIWIPKRKKNRS